MRDFIITSKRFYNIGKFRNIITKLLKGTVRRVFDIGKIKAISYSKLANYFILHIPSEYDYYFISADRDEVIEYILQVLALSGVESLDFFIVD